MFNYSSSVCVKIRKKETKIFELNKLAAEKIEEDMDVKNDSKKDEKVNDMKSVIIDYDSYCSNVQNGVPLNKGGDPGSGCFGFCGSRKKEDDSSCIVF